MASHSLFSALEAGRGAGETGCSAPAEEGLSFDLWALVRARPASASLSALGTGGVGVGGDAAVGGLVLTQSAVRSALPLHRWDEDGLSSITDPALIRCQFMSL